MEKLSTENIRFIDTYLKKSGVEYLDIRTEMVDHVASEIEARLAKEETGEFYDVFKAYMARNKRSLLQGLKKFRKEADRKVFKQVLRNLYHPKALVFGSLLTLGLFWLMEFFKLDSKDGQGIHFVFLILLCAVSFWRSSKIKYSFTRGMGRAICLLYLLLVLNREVFEYYNFWYFLALLIYESALLKTALELKAHYRNKYTLV